MAPVLGMPLPLVADLDQADVGRGPRHGGGAVAVRDPQIALGIDENAHRVVLSQAGDQRDRRGDCDGGRGRGDLVQGIWADVADVEHVAGLVHTHLSGAERGGAVAEQRGRNRGDDRRHKGGSGGIRGGSAGRQDQCGGQAAQSAKGKFQAVAPRYGCVRSSCGTPVRFVIAMAAYPPCGKCVVQPATGPLGTALRVRSCTWRKPRERAGPSYIPHSQSTASRPHCSRPRQGWWR